MAYIDREAAKACIHKWLSDIFGIDDVECTVLDKRLNAIPSADVVERTKGKWLMKLWDTYYFRCSVCGEQSGSKWPFCHHCGADMREEKDNG